MKLEPEEVALIVETLFQKADRLDDTFERSNSRTKFRIKDKADALRAIIKKLQSQMAKEATECTCQPGSVSHVRGCPLWTMPL